MAVQILSDLLDWFCRNFASTAQRIKEIRKDFFNNSSLLIPHS